MERQEDRKMWSFKRGELASIVGMNRRELKEAIEGNGLQLDVCIACGRAFKNDDLVTIAQNGQGTCQLVHHDERCSRAKGITRYAPPRRRIGERLDLVKS